MSMTDATPTIVVIGGPNGAGKTTVALEVLPYQFDIKTFVNADTIARGLSDFNPLSQAFAASRIMLARIQQLAAMGVSFAFESTLASRSLAPWIREVRRDGYRVFITFVWVDSAETAVQRVARRVEAGGHSIPVETIRRRYARSIRNFRDLYVPLVDQWSVYDNSGVLGPDLVAHGSMSAQPNVVLADVWKRIQGT